MHLSLFLGYDPLPFYFPGPKGEIQDETAEEFCINLSVKTFATPTVLAVPVEDSLGGA